MWANLQVASQLCQDRGTLKTLNQRLPPESLLASRQQPEPHYLCWIIRISADAWLLPISPQLCPKPHRILPLARQYEELPCLLGLGISSGIWRNRLSPWRWRCLPPLVQYRRRESHRRNRQYSQMSSSMTPLILQGMPLKPGIPLPSVVSSVSLFAGGP